MKKKVFILYLVLVISVSIVGCSQGSSSPNDSENDWEQGNLVLYSSMTENDITNLLEGFGEEYPDIDVEVVNGSAGELTARIGAESNNPQGDIMWGGLSNSDGDVHSDLFEHWLSDHEDEVMDEYKSNNGYYNLDHLSSVVFAVNTDLEEELGLEINAYEDLLDPKLKGSIIISDPNSSSAAWNNISNIMSVYGNDTEESWNYIESLMKNDIVISTSSSNAFKDVEVGEYVVGMTYEDGVSTLLKSGAENIKMVYPKEGSSASAFGCAVIKDASNMEAAKAMVNDIMSKEGQNYLGEKLGTIRFTNRNAEYETPYLPETSEVNWVDRDVD